MTELVAVKKPKFLYSMPESENRVESFGLEGIFRITRFQPCEWKMDLRPCAVCVLRVQSLELFFRPLMLFYYWLQKQVFCQRWLKNT